ncbi:hypothetical protein GCM10022220_59070 [Actinocatenispora rupis]|uniref:Uncharacterized protein n=1 Tax=Actinocatenispora rupis TaxID=519421 RepID=A0A8J3ND27_9ACTN|nr:hypothetical protein Aru02nite_19580 [Actinocatenispora rupis]
MTTWPDQTTPNRPIPANRVPPHTSAPAPIHGHGDSTGPLTQRTAAANPARRVGRNERRGPLKVPESTVPPRVENKA